MAKRKLLAGKNFDLFRYDTYVMFVEKVLFLFCNNTGIFLESLPSYLKYLLQNILIYNIFYLYYY